MVGEIRGSPISRASRCLSWPSLLYPLLLYGVHNFLVYLISGVSTLFNFVSRAAIRVYRTFEQVLESELDLWFESIWSRFPTFFMNWIVLPLHSHYLFAEEFLARSSRRPIQNYRKSFKGTITAFPREKCMFSYYQYSSWFAHFIGAMMLDCFMGSTAGRCWSETVLRYGPAYTYFAGKVKKPPDGAITAFVILTLMMISNVLLIMRGLLFIWWYTSCRDSKCKVYSSAPTIVERIGNFKNKFLKKLSLVHPRHVSSCFTSMDLKSTLDRALSSGTRFYRIGFDPEATTMVLDNSATCHICNSKEVFIDNITDLDSDSVGVETAGGIAQPEGKGSIRITFHDNDGKYHTKDIHDVLYFPSSPVNILGITKLGQQWNDEDGVCISTKSKYSTFTWNGGQSHRTVSHHSSGLPELPINEGDSSFSTFFTSFYSCFPVCKSTKNCLLSRVTNCSLQNSESYASRSCF